MHRNTCRFSCEGGKALLEAGRSPVGVPMRSLKNLNLPNPSSHAMALGLTQPLTEMSTRSRKIKFLGTRARPVRKADNRTVICELTV
jgi:hypothetical protein